MQGAVNCYVTSHPECRFGRLECFSVRGSMAAKRIFESPSSGNQTIYSNIRETQRKSYKTPRGQKLLRDCRTLAHEVTGGSTRSEEIALKERSDQPHSTALR